MKYCLIYDECIATADRRPATFDDIKNGIHVERGNIYPNAILGRLCDLAGYYPKDVEEEELATFDDKIKFVLKALNDPSDGSPNIIYLSINGKVYVDWAEDYTGIVEDPEKLSEDEFIKLYLENLEYEEDDVNEEE